MDLPGVPPDMKRKFIRLRGLIEKGYIPTEKEKWFMKNVADLTTMYVKVNGHASSRRKASC